MKTLIASLLMASALVVSARADGSTVTISDTHMCCHGCEKAVDKIAAGIPGLTATSDLENESITLSAPDSATLQKGVDALTANGFFGKSSDPNIKVNGATGATGAKVTSLTITGVHVCCGHCVKAINEALAPVQGVTGNTAAKGATSFTVTGNFTDTDVMNALQKAGLTGQVAKQ